MKTITRSITAITIMVLLGACASQAGNGPEREYRNPYLRAKHIAAPVKTEAGGDQPCMTRSTQ